MPTSNQIDTAIKNIPHFFHAKKVLGGECILNKKGKPFCKPGGLCRVYKFRLDDGSIKALRIWTDIISEAKERSMAISDFILAHPSDYFVNFECIDDALAIDGVLYPIVLMDWCQGKNMKAYISDCVLNGEFDRIKELAHSFYLMTKELYRMGISHGDLHHENIMVLPDGKLKLIDYDSMYVPVLNGHFDECQGYEGYQHPTARISNKYLQPYTDYFSELVIYMTIYLVGYHPELWDVDKVDDYDKALLFKISELDVQAVNQYKDWNILGLPFLIEWYKKNLRKSDLKDLKPLSFIVELANIYGPVSPPSICLEDVPVKPADVSTISNKW